MFKRVFLFLATNFAVVILLRIIAQLLGFEDSQSLTYLLVYASLIGFAGSFISLMLSKSSAKRSTGAHIIDQPKNSTEQWLVSTIERLATNANIKMPEVGIYQGEPNAFATGASKDSSLVCVSSGLMSTMSQDEVEAVLGHEISHAANGDMVTMALLQGVINTFVIFLSMLIASAVAGGNNNRNAGAGAYYAVSWLCQIVFGFLASIIVCYFSRRREYRADAGSSYLLGSPKKMIAALRKLQRIQSGDLPQGLKTFGITDKPASFLRTLFSTHPPLEDRILALEESRIPAKLDN